MPPRSSTGCYMCKLKRQKCDETKPRCLRCSGRELECEYEYIKSNRSAKKRTKSAPRPPSEKAKRLAKLQSSLMTTSVLGNAPQVTNALGCYFLSSSDYDMTLPQDGTWETTPSLDATYTTQAALVNPTTLTPAPQAEPFFGTPYETEPSLELYSALVPTSYSYLHNSYDNSEDHEGANNTVCPTAYTLGLDRTAESNLLPFALQSYSQWIMLVAFDPMKSVHGIKEAVIGHFFESPTSRSRTLIISELMRKVVKFRFLDEASQRALGLMEDEISRNIVTYQAQQWPLSEEERKQAYAALNNTLELISIQIIFAPLAYILRHYQLTAPVFLSTCPPPHPPSMSEILLKAGTNAKHFVAGDIATSITTDLSKWVVYMWSRYHVPWSLEFSYKFMEKNQDGLQWLLGIPDQFVLLFGYMDSLKKDAKAAGTMIDPRAIGMIEADIKRMVLSQCQSRDLSVSVKTVVVQECWREAMLIYLYMALCGADALDPRVKRAQNEFMRLMDTISPGRHADIFLAIPTMIVGVATTEQAHQTIIVSRFIALPEFANPNTTGSDQLLILKDIWSRTDMEARAARWEDLRKACWRVTCV